MIALTPDALFALRTPLLVAGDDGRLRPSDERIDGPTAPALVRARMLHKLPPGKHTRRLTPAGAAVVEVAREIERRGLVVSTSIDTDDAGGFSIVVMLDRCSVVVGPHGCGVVRLDGPTPTTIATPIAVVDAFDQAFAFMATMPQSQQGAS